MASQILGPAMLSTNIWIRYVLNQFKSFNSVQTNNVNNLILTGTENVYFHGISQLMLTGTQEQL